MLEQLTIDQIAIIEHSEIHFRPGYNVLTGETGAGKSILIDALGLVLGERADASSIRHGEKRATVSATFRDLSAAHQQALADDGLDDPDNPGQVVIRRTLRDGGSKAWVNDQNVTGGKLKTLAAALVNIHGQHHNQALLKNDEQRRRLDRYAGHRELLAACADAWRHWQQLEKDHSAWQTARSSDEERLALLAYQLDEIEQLAPQEDEFDQLAAKQTLLASADQILASGSRLAEQLSNGEHNLHSALRHAQREAEHLAAIHDNYRETAELLEQSAVYLSEASDSLAKQLGKIEHDPEALAETEARMSALHALARKHHIDPGQLPAHWQTLAAEHEALSQKNQSGSALEAACRAAEADYHTKAAALSTARQKAAPALARDVEQWIHQLGMEKATFAIDVQPAARPAAHGNDDITYTLCANPGQTLQPLAKVASGGELSRVSLAIEVACLDETPTPPPTIIFDEIDTGIGGEIADTVGRLLHTLGQNRQVLCITHLPQVAAYADAHYRIEKHSDNHATQTRVTALDDEARITEIARMLGSAASDTSRDHARTMLARKASVNITPRRRAV
ncbi:DNA repair protein RecN [uncultured Cardiobacterium sp.]|uniref:DNA repair protein RecN n=1 Tax=uncultured Cardiobacterium sp. TaxID=417619 RepID=UPI00261192C0|nr:DNA repair protein RecN [uncultured Cardiobacterium sp.]